MDQHGWVILVGCCGWPERRDAYVAEFPVVELQHTFYQLPSERLAETVAIVGSSRIRVRD
jgi:uncharacterized protein YecE (DUF72 family)